MNTAQAPCLMFWKEEFEKYISIVWAAVYYELLEVSLNKQQINKCENWY
jgi:hypothetical protein